MNFKRKFKSVPRTALLKYELNIRNNLPASGFSSMYL